MKSNIPLFNVLKIIIMNVKKEFLNVWVHEFWPVSLMKDCSKGKPIQRLMAYRYNQSQVQLLEIPILNWIILILYFICAMNIFENMHIARFAYIEAFFAVLAVFSLVGALILSIAYIFLKNVDANLV